MGELWQLTFVVLTCLKCIASLSVNHACDNYQDLVLLGLSCWTVHCMIPKQALFTASTRQNVRHPSGQTGKSNAGEKSCVLMANDAKSFYLLAACRRKKENGYPDPVCLSHVKHLVTLGCTDE